MTVETHLARIHFRREPHEAAVKGGGCLDVYGVVFYQLQLRETVMDLFV